MAEDCAEDSRGSTGRNGQARADRGRADRGRADRAGRAGGRASGPAVRPGPIEPGPSAEQAEPEQAEGGYRRSPAAAGVTPAATHASAIMPLTCITHVTHVSPARLSDVTKRGGSGSGSGAWSSRWPSGPSWPGSTRPRGPPELATVTGARLGGPGRVTGSDRGPGPHGGSQRVRPAGIPTRPVGNTRARAGAGRARPRGPPIERGPSGPAALGLTGQSPARPGPTRPERPERVEK